MKNFRCHILYLLLFTSATSFGMDIDDVCLVKLGFPKATFQAEVEYQILDDRKIIFRTLIEGIEKSDYLKLEVFYGVPNIFKWSPEEVDGNGYEFFSDVNVVRDENGGSADLILKKSFSNFALHLTIKP